MDDQRLRATAAWSAWSVAGGMLLWGCGAVANTAGFAAFRLVKAVGLLAFFVAGAVLFVAVVRMSMRRLWPTGSGLWMVGVSATVAGTALLLLFVFARRRGVAWEAGSFLALLLGGPLMWVTAHRMRNGKPFDEAIPWWGVLLNGL